MQVVYRVKTLATNSSSRIHLLAYRFKTCVLWLRDSFGRLIRRTLYWLAVFRIDPAILKTVLVSIIIPPVAPFTRTDR